MLGLFEDRLDDIARRIVVRENCDIRPGRAGRRAVSVDLDRDVGRAGRTAHHAHEIRDVRAVAERGVEQAGEVKRIV